MADENKTKLSDEELERELQTLEGWSKQGKAMVRRFLFTGFGDITRFMKLVANTIEAQNHHPDLILDTVTRSVTVTVLTHSEGGVTQADVDFARALNAG